MRPRAALRAGLAALVCAVLLGRAAGGADSGVVYVTRIDDMINAGTAAHLEESLRLCVSEGCHALVVELNTEGGALGDMRTMVEAILNASVPVIVYVSPRGALAASAGMFITLAGHIAAMAPGTSIGAAHPVIVGGGDPGGPLPPVPSPSAPGSPTPTSEPGATPPGWRGNFIGQKIENITVAYAESIAR